MKKKIDKLLTKVAERIMRENVTISDKFRNQDLDDKDVLPEDIYRKIMHKTFPELFDDKQLKTIQMFFTKEDQFDQVSFLETLKTKIDELVLKENTIKNKKERGRSRDKSSDKHTGVDNMKRDKSGGKRSSKDYGGGGQAGGQDQGGRESQTMGGSSQGGTQKGGAVIFSLERYTDLMSAKKDPSAKKKSKKR